MKKYLLILTALFAFQIIWAQKYISKELFITSYDSVRLSGTLLMPKKEQTNLTLAIIIAGSGPTDRDGNNNMMTNNSLKYLAEDLIKNKIASFRYDKRAIGKSLSAKLKEEDLRFENYIDDVIAVVNYFQNDKRFGSIVIIGHSEGSLLGILAAKKTKVDKYISIAGVARTADKILAEQLYDQYRIKNISGILDSLKQGYTVKNVGKLKNLFRPSVQPYIISWFKYNPQQEIAELSCPVLILQGDNDIQVKLKEAKLLKESCPHAKLEIISGMNHIMKIIKGDFNKNLKSYYNADLPVSNVLVKKIVAFIKE